MREKGSEGRKTKGKGADDLRRSYDAEGKKERVFRSVAD